MCLMGIGLFYEKNGTDTIWYMYDGSGHRVCFNLNGTYYYYVYNLQGDVVSIINSTGSIVAAYTYDSWGKLISIKDDRGNDITNNTSSVGYKNPYRYRGYRYDNETKLYYLQSRYYDPDTGRFINAEGYLSTGQSAIGTNMFAYCGNDAVNNFDPTGKLFLFVIEETLVPPNQSLILPEITVPDISIPTLPGEITFIGPMLLPLDLAPNISQRSTTKNERGPMGRANRKKQGREVNEGKRDQEGWRGNPNRNPNRNMKKHTPARDHQIKYKSLTIIPIPIDNDFIKSYYFGATKSINTSLSDQNGQFYIIRWN